MSVTELIEEAERDLSPWRDLHRAKRLLPLLVAVIKNQQRQIALAVATIKDQESRFKLEQFHHGEALMDYAIQQINMVAAELEDVKP